MNLKKGRRPFNLSRTLGWLGGLFLALWLAYAVLVPVHSGFLGLRAHEGLVWLFGKGGVLLPLLALYALAVNLRSKKTLGPWLQGLTCLGVLLSASGLLHLAGTWAGDPSWGGASGDLLAGAAAAVFGTLGAWLLTLAVLLLGLQILFDISWKDVAAGAVSALREDWQEWQRARKQWRSELELAAAPAPFKGDPVVEEAPTAFAPPVEEKPAPIEFKSDEGRAAPSSSKESRRKVKETAPAPEPAAPGTPYNLPSLDLLTPAVEGMSGKPTEEELRAAIAMLEKTLASFEIQARVSGVSPGPVITRYEVTPAPGVRVSEIVNLSNDIALALKAKAVRMIAPIPGKAAIGIEIPNPRPAQVTLREILESPAFPAARTLIPFALGRMSEGDPMVSDVVKMPHVLVAGATNSGKSVLVHDLLLSVLYRAHPDEVKMLLIDPKRLELTFYEGIPHLFDPKTPCEEVTVVTDPKEAAKSLKLLVKVMENRYEKFKAYGVRNIDSYNETAAKKGYPREYYILVVIDELADLMLVAGDNAADSIQRLAQMARAVGIHLVVATQRPSVDVITGVIKANLTTRIALQVASAIDSRVILDTIGAEQLLGKGDLLYSVTGGKPIRVQAPYVSEDDIRKVADFVRSQGKPNYLLPDVGPKLSQVTDGKGAQPEELRQALGLVFERRRVSQDLLKAHFGSSAKATDLLSLLEVRGFIHKPEGTNRWEIYYDKIEEYLKAIQPKGPGPDSLPS